MAAVHGQLGEDDGVPFPFRHAVDALRGARVRSEVRIEEVTAPRRLASYAYALEATVLADGEELADGRVVLLHEPAGHEAWHGTFRLVTLARADLEPEMAGDPLLPEVSWSWLTGALAARGADHDEPSGTVSRASSHFFGGLGERPDETRIELRASWSPRERPGGTIDVAAHLAAWCDLLCTCAGLPPAEGPDAPVRGAAGVVPLPKRRT
ncbi:DUF3000 domain-containing protein [Actinacidiphila bryophytorum]|uniref:DUF3000 domain-containing protein n=1 Tax=Actinacidiphila bryophytorum TaxID=1436133 RepID=UPI002176EFF5|nr:DUF3000 domain-containing protein [Actinacidiphila bryophytorum]UWE11670.1 DUF3000 domain-containing protein [Actinacidiphila bryophytorum]